jgi:hypothetical protein
MTTKLASFKTFLQKAKKPCGPGQHRHWGYDYCHPITSVHHKHNKMGINPHHGMEFGGAIPTGTIPPNIEDHHHLAKPHGEKTGATGGNCNPVEYPKGSGKVVPAHRHTGADYCHPLTQKHGGSASLAQEWHNTHQADIEQTWKLFNDQQGLEGDTTPGTFDQDAIEDPVPSPAPLLDPLDALPEADLDADNKEFEVPSQGTVDNPLNLQVGNIIQHPTWGKTPLEIIDIPSDVDPNDDDMWIVVSDGTGDEHYLKANDPTLSVVDAQAGLPTGDVVNPLNPHDLQVGTTVSYPAFAGGVLDTEVKITDISDVFNTVKYTTTPAGGTSWDSEQSLEGFNLWVTDNIKENGSWSVQHPGIHDIPNPQSPSIPTGSTDDPYTEEYLNSLPKVGESFGDVDALASLPPGTQFMAENGQVVTLLEVQQGLNADGNKVVTNYHLNLGELGDMWFNGDEWPSGFGKTGYEPVVSTLPSDVSSAMDKGFQLGGAVIPAILDDLPVGLVFTYGMGTTATITQNLGLGPIPGTSPGDGIKVTFTMSDGTIYEDVPVDSTMLATISEGAKIVALPSGLASQQVTEKAPVFNKHGLAVGTTLELKNVYGEMKTGTITKTHKTKAGQNYTIDFEGGGQVKVPSTNFQDPESEGEYGYFVTDAVHKPGQEPTDVSPLALPPMFSEPGNFDDVLEQVGGQLGYNEGGTFKHKQTGEQYYIKFSSSGNDEQVKSEALANNLYELLGISTLGTSLISFKGKTALKSPWNDNLETIPIGQMSKEAGIMDSFVADAWLANWDVIGPKNDNTQKSGNTIVKIDSGGALKFGGAGGAKAFTSTVNELESLRDPNKAKVAYQVFQNITTENLVTGAQKLAKVTDAHIDAIVDNSQISNKQNMKEVLKDRRDAIVQKLLNKSQTAASEELGHPGQHKHGGYTGWHAIEQKHDNPTANNAHKKLGLPYDPPKVYTGSTSTPETLFWNALDTSTNSPQIKELAKKALAYDFKAKGSRGARTQAIQEFLTDNNIANSFANSFSGWQGGNQPSSNIPIRAALFKLKGLTSDPQSTIKQSEGSFWSHIMKAKSFDKSWDIGLDQAMAIIPYVAASQQYLQGKLAHSGGTFTMYRGLHNSPDNPVATNVQKSLSIGGSGGIYYMPNDGISGWSHNSNTAKSFSDGGGKNEGVVFSKTGLTPEDILIDFNAFSSAHTGEMETLVDSAAVRDFSFDEVQRFDGK